MPVLLVIDDEASIRHAFHRAFRDGDLKVVTATTAAEGILMFESQRPDVIVLDVHLPDSSGLETFEHFKQVDPRVPVILITGHGTTELAIEAMREGAYEYLLKPLELPELRRLTAQAVESSRLMRTRTLLADGPTGDNAAQNEDAHDADEGDVMVGRCPAMQEIYKSIGRVSRQDVTVLISGESGTGKELVARAIYQHSDRADRPFLAINCAAIPDNLLESELFGSERGAFTGADRRRIGKFEQCNGGTLFLDEIGEMSLATQAKILRLIQEQAFQRVGGSETIRTDVRLIAATNADLMRMVDAGTFRRDLFYRLHVFTIELPPLRERGDDVRLLAQHHFQRIAKQLGKVGAKLPPESLALLARYPWPGNIRELQSVLKQGLLQMSGHVLLPEFIPSAIVNDTAVKSEPVATGAYPWDEFVSQRLIEGCENLHEEATRLMEKDLILRVLNHTAGNQLQAARILGITRGSLRNKIRNLGIQIAKSAWSEDGHDES